MKTIIRVILALVLLSLVFTSGLAIGQRRGFVVGSEWAIAQTALVAREAGVILPMRMESGQLRIVVKQPRNLYHEAWRLADRYEETMRDVNKGTGSLAERVPLIRTASLQP
jgi:hypothetical protein